MMRSILTLLLFLHSAILVAQQNNPVDEKKFISINGMEHWITIKGDRNKPVVMFIHGGPGSTATPYADSIFKGWEKDFVLVNYDQRGAGKTFGRIAPAEISPAFFKSNPLSADQLTSDGIEIARYVLNDLKKQKLILLASSWGTIVATKMALKNPGLFTAYIGHSQLVNPAASNEYAYSRVYDLAEKNSDLQSVDILKNIGKPPYDTARNLGKLMRVVKKYQQKNSVPAPASWWRISSEYDNETDNRHREEGDDYSFLYYAGDKRLAVKSMAAGIDFMKDGFELKVPVYLVQGEEDIQTPLTINKSYFEKIISPAKKFLTIPHADHGFNEAVVNTIFNLLRNELVVSK